MRKDLKRFVILKLSQPQHLSVVTAIVRQTVEIQNSCYNIMFCYIFVALLVRKEEAVSMFVRH